MRRIVLLAPLLAVAACGGAAEDDGEVAGSGGALEQAAMEAGVIADPDDFDLTGQYGPVDGAGPDRFCAIGEGASAYRVGLLATFGAGTQCEGRGTARLQGERATLTLRSSDEAKGDAACEVEAAFDGEVLRLPGVVPQECQALCNDRASLAGVAFRLRQPGGEAASATGGRALDRLCIES